jgi:hypothetical protein
VCQKTIARIPAAPPCHGCISRREWICGAAGCAAALLGQPVAAQPPRAGASGKPRILVAFVHPAVDRYFMGWPGASYDIKAREAEYRKLLADAAAASSAQLEIHPEPVGDEPAGIALAEKTKASPPDGVVLVIQSLNTGWTPVTAFAQRRGDTPVFVFSPQGTSFTANLQAFRKSVPARRTFVAATSDSAWLRHGVHLLRTIWDMQQTRICVVQGKAAEEVKLAALGGATLRYVPFERVEQEYVKVSENEEIRRLAREYRTQARRIIEPSAQEIVDAIKHVVVCRRIMESEGCQGLAMDCLPHVKGKKVPPPCLAFSHLNDLGITAACQADWPAALSLRLTYLLLGRPGFMQNNCVNSADNTLIGAHCTCPTRLSGPGAPRAPYVLRRHAESHLGVATQVLWPVNQDVTIMKFSDVMWMRKPAGDAKFAASILLSAGRVIRNVDLPPSGGCVTSVEVKPEGIDDITTINPLHHQLFILGNYVSRFKAYCELAGLEARRI